MPKKLPEYIKAKAIQMRIERQMSIDEIAERLALPRTTVYYWVRDIPLGREPRPSPHIGAFMNREVSRLRREIAYTAGVASFPFLAEDPLFRDFVALYIAEGHKRSRNSVSVSNSDPAVIRVCVRFMRRFARNPLRYSVQYHADQDLDEIQRFWGSVLDVEPERVTVQRKSNSNQLKGRTWRSQYGVLAISAGDTEFRSKLQGWIDCIRAEWT